MTVPNSATPKVPVDGDIAVALRALRSHTFQNESELKEEAEKDFGDEDSFWLLLAHLKENELVKTSNLGLSLSPKGEGWLDENGFGLEVEKEDLGADGKPTKPYAVAKLKMEPKHLSVFQALRKIERKEINLSPDFQRAFVWDDVKQSRLIESVLIRIPLPAFYLDATDQVNWNVVDGLQRLTTLYRYCRGASFPLKGLQFLRDLEELTFDKLPAKYQVLIEDDTQLLFYNLMPGTPLEAKFTIFSRVNTGGMQLTPQEIRHALNQGPVTNLLSRLAREPSFRRATQGVVESLRMSDRELVLRALAFMQSSVDEYKEFNELDAFLLNAMTKLNQLSAQELDALAEEFIESVEKVHKIFGRYAFRKFTQRGGRRSPLNKALFETWVVSVRRYSQGTLMKNQEAILVAFAELISHSVGFVRSISSNTASFSAVNTRFTEVRKLLEEQVK